MEKKYSGYLIVNWKDNSVRFRQSPSSMVYEVSILLHFNIKVPELKPLEVTLGTIEIPEAIAELAQAEVVIPSEEEF